MRFKSICGGFAVSAVDDLGDSGRALWDAINESREVSAEFTALVLNACRITDRLDEMSGRLLNEPLTVKLCDKQGQEINEVANPLLVEHRMQLQTLRTVLSSLGVDRLSIREDGASMEEAMAEARKARLGLVK